MILNYINKIDDSKLYYQENCLGSDFRIKIIMVNLTFYISPNKPVATMFQSRYTLGNFYKLKLESLPVSR
jgi:hypothetical protein